MAEVAPYDGDYTATVHADPDSPFAIYLARFQGDPDDTYRINVTGPKQGGSVGQCWTSQPLSAIALTDSCLSIIRLLKNTSKWPDVKQKIAEQLG